MVLNLRTEISKKRYLASRIRQSIRFERLFERRAVRLLDGQARAASRAYKESGGDEGVVMAAVDAYTHRWNALYISTYRNAGFYFARQLVGDVLKFDYPTNTKTFDDFKLRFMEYIRLFSADKVKRINTTTRIQIKEAITAATSEGLGPADVAKRIYGKVSGIGKIKARNRVRMIARTEIHNAAQAASYQVTAELPISMNKEWLPAEDDRTRPTHAAMRDYPAIPKDELFSVGKASLRYPGDPTGPAEEVINCRCDLIWHSILQPNK